MNLNNIEEVFCPVCDKKFFSLIYLIDGWNIVKCRECNFVYTNPRLESSALLKIYSDNYFNNKEVGYYLYSDNKELRRKNFSKWIKDARPFFKKDTPINSLDIGCAAGYCLEILRENGFNAHGVELDKQYANQLNSNGFTIYNSPLLNTNFTTKYSLITLFDVIEHLPDLQEHLRKIYEILDDDGIVVIITPNYNSLQRKLFGKKWFQFKPKEHINYFSKKTLEALANKTHFKVILSKRAGQYCDVSFLRNRVEKYGLKMLIPFVSLLSKISANRKKYLYVDTASLYVVLKKS